jgi:hypothetical protein
MATKPDNETASAKSEPGVKSKKRAVKAPIAGNFSYTNTPKKFKETLDALIVAERPERFNRDFIEAVLNVKGGSVTGFPPIMKRIGFLSSDGVPTDLYDKFRSGSARSGAAFEGLKAGFGELFRRNAYAHRLPEAKIKDMLVEITGRARNDENISAIYGTFDAIRQFVTEDAGFSDSPSGHGGGEQPSPQLNDNAEGASEMRENPRSWGLSYQINVVLPETSDISVFNAIFKSLRDNLLKD